MRTSIVTRMILWIWVIAASILVGGAIYETLVLTPLWAGSPPDSVTAWKYGGPQVIFFGPLTPIYGIVSFVLLIASFWMSRRLKRFSQIAAVAGVIAVTWTFLFFVPILMQTESTAGAGLAGEEITRLTNQFVSWNYLRLGLLIVGWLAGLKAFSILSSTDRSSRPIEGTRW